MNSNNFDKMIEDLNLILNKSFAIESMKQSRISTFFFVCKIPLKSIMMVLISILYLYILSFFCVFHIRPVRAPVKSLVLQKLHNVKSNLILTRKNYYHKINTNWIYICNQDDHECNEWL